MHQNLANLPSSQKDRLLHSLANQIERLEQQLVRGRLGEHSVLVNKQNEIDRLRVETEECHEQLAEERALNDRLEDRVRTLDLAVAREAKQLTQLTSELDVRSSMFLTIMAKQKAKHLYAMQVLEASKVRESDQRCIVQLEDVLNENESLHSEIDSLRSSLLQLSECVENLELENLEKDFKIKKLEKQLAEALANAKAPGSPVTPFPGGNLSVDTKLSPSTPTTASPTKGSSPKGKSAKPSSPATDLSTHHESKHEVKSFISSWFTETEEDANHGKDMSIAAAEETAIEAAVKHADEIAKQKEVEKKASRTAQLLNDSKSFFAAAKSLKAGPGAMVVALTKCEHDLELTQARIKTLQAREERANELLRVAEETMLAMVKNVEEEAVGLMEYDFNTHANTPLDAQALEQKAAQQQALPSSDLVSPSSGAAARINAELNHKVTELERQKKTLLDLLNDYENDKNAEDGGSFRAAQDLARLSLFSPRQDLDIRMNLKDILGLGGEVTDEDLLYEAQILVQERELVLLELDEKEEMFRQQEQLILNLAEKDEAARIASEENDAAHADSLTDSGGGHKRKKPSPSASPTSGSSKSSPFSGIHRRLSDNTNQEVAELVRAKELQTMARRSRHHSVALTHAKIVSDEMEQEEAKAAMFHSQHHLEHSVQLSGTVDAVETFELEKAKSAHAKKQARLKKQTMTHSSAADAMAAFEKEELEEETAKARSRIRGKLQRQHTVKHSSAQAAVNLANLKVQRRGLDEADESDAGSGDEDGEGEEDEDELAAAAEAEKAAKEAAEEAARLEAEAKAAAEAEAIRLAEEAEVVKHPEDVQYPNTQLILNTSKMYEDPLHNFYKFSMTVSYLGYETVDGYKVFRISCYDSEQSREMAMDVPENLLRTSLKHEPSSFTYDEMDGKFQEYVLDRLKLIPGHDKNHDGFLNEEDVVRSDLTVALLSEGRWKPLKVMVETGEKALEKRRAHAALVRKNKKDMAMSVAEEQKRRGRMTKIERAALGGSMRNIDTSAIDIDETFEDDVAEGRVNLRDLEGMDRRQSEHHAFNSEDYEIVISRDGHADLHEGHAAYVDDFE
jgi:hypothetical protein